MGLTHELRVAEDMKTWILLLAFFSMNMVSCSAEQSVKEPDGQSDAVRTLEVSNGAKDTGASITDTLVYQSGANGLADIRLTIIPNGQFAFYMRTIPQPMTEDEEAIVNSTGTWSQKDKWVTLTFIEGTPILNAVFDSTYAVREDLRVTDERTVVINTEREQQNIWGVVCDRISEH